MHTLEKRFIHAKHSDDTNTKQGEPQKDSPKRRCAGCSGSAQAPNQRLRARPLARAACRAAAVCAARPELEEHLGCRHCPGEVHGVLGSVCLQRVMRIPGRTDAVGPCCYDTDKLRETVGSWLFFTIYLCTCMRTYRIHCFCHVVLIHHENQTRN